MSDILPQVRRPERRYIKRTAINRNVHVFFSGQPGTLACVVCEVTNEGAGMRIAGVHLIPTDFDVSFDNFVTVRKCHLVWREGDFLGTRWSL